MKLPALACSVSRVSSLISSNLAAPIFSQEETEDEKKKEGNVQPEGEALKQFA